MASSACSDSSFPPLRALPEARVPGRPVRPARAADRAARCPARRPPPDPSARARGQSAKGRRSRMLTRAGGRAPRPISGSAARHWAKSSGQSAPTQAQHCGRQIRPRDACALAGGRDGRGDVRDRFGGRHRCRHCPPVRRQAPCRRPRRRAPQSCWPRHRRRGTGPFGAAHEAHAPSQAARSASTVACGQVCSHEAGQSGSTGPSTTRRKMSVLARAADHQKDPPRRQETLSAPGVIASRGTSLWPPDQ